VCVGGLGEGLGEVAPNIHVALPLLLWISSYICCMSADVLGSRRTLSGLNLGFDVLGSRGCNLICQRIFVAA
jgi:hypothetical protein